MLTEGKWVYFLFLLVEGLDAVQEKVRREIVQLVGRVVFAVSDDKRAVEVSGAVDLERVGVRVARELGAVALQE